MAEHVLKTVGYCWDAVNAGLKTFEVRRNDRGFQPGDTVILRKLSEDGRNVVFGPQFGADGSYLFNGRCVHSDLRFRIGWMLQGGQFGIEPGYCVFSLEKEAS